VIPPATYNVPRLSLPHLGADRHGSTIPLIISTGHEDENDLQTRSQPTHTSERMHPKHRLGVSSFALDTSTKLIGKNSPEGILYSGGRDGQVIAHELGAPLKQRSRAYGSGPEGKGKVNSWEAITGWNETDDETEEDDKGAIHSSELPFENTWELDTSLGEPSLVSAILCHVLKIRLKSGRRNYRSDNPYKVILIGLMIYFCATSTELVNIFFI
jgi:hypothetical protein